LPTTPIFGPSPRCSLELEGALSVFNNCAKHGERMPRDAKIHTILGTSDFQQLVIARAISGLRVE